MSFPFAHREAEEPSPRRARRGGRFAFNTLAVTVLSLGLAGFATAQSPTASAQLSLAAALQAAESRSAALPAQDAARRGFREMAVSAASLPDPVLRLSVDNLPIEGPMRYSLTDDFMTMRSLSLMQTFPGADKRQARGARFEREADAAASMRTMQVARLRTQTARAWFERYYQQQLVELLQRQREEAALVAGAVEAAYRGGRGGQAEVFMARAAVARLDDRLHEARAGLSNAGTLLARWVGDAAAQPSGLPPRLDRTRMAAHELTHQLDRHPDLALMNAREQVALAEAEVARQDKSADPSWSLMYSKRGEQFSDMVSVGVSIPLQWDRKNRQDRELAARLEKVEQVRAEREEMRREHLADVQRLLASWRSNLARLDDYDRSLIPLAAQRAEAAQAAFRGGKGPLAAVLEARRMEIDSRVERLRIERQTAALWAELEFLIPDSADLSTDLPTIPAEEHQQ